MTTDEQFKINDTVYLHFPFDSHVRTWKAKIVSLEDVYGYDGNNCTVVFYNPIAGCNTYQRANTASFSREDYNARTHEAKLKGFKDDQTDNL